MKANRVFTMSVPDGGVPGRSWAAWAAPVFDHGRLIVGF